MNGRAVSSRGGSNVRTWSLGLINESGHYLTAESFGYKINASAVSMKKKQMWTLVHVDKDPEVEVESVYLQSHLGYYLCCDSKGNARCDEESTDEKEAVMEIVYCPKTGRWGFRSKKHGLHFGGQDDFLKFDTKVQWWTARLAVHPHVNVRNISRKSYAFLDPKLDQVLVEKVIPWGPESLITIEFCEQEGKYAVRASNGKYINYDGQLTAKVTPDCLYTIEVKSNQVSGVALKASDGRFLSAEGRPPVMKCKSKGRGGGVASKDEIFTLEESHAQVYITSHNGRKVSTKQGVDLSANQDEVTDKEVFQVEYDKEEAAWRLRTCDDKYWSLEQAQGIQARSANKGQTGLFYIDWQKSGAATIKASNGKYVTAKMNGSLLATVVEPGEKEMFIFSIINRPIIILRTEFGFVGMKVATSTKVECNKSNYDMLFLELSDKDDGFYHLKGPNGRYLSVGQDGTVAADSNEPTRYVLELSSQSRVRIRDEANRYLMGEANGTMRFGGNKITEWEY